MAYRKSNYVSKGEVGQIPGSRFVIFLKPEYEGENIKDKKKLGPTHTGRIFIKRIHE